MSDIDLTKQLLQYGDAPIYGQPVNYSGPVSTSQQHFSNVPSSQSSPNLDDEVEMLNKGRARGESLSS